jgi:hypothetical protein
LRNSPFTFRVSSETRVICDVVLLDTPTIKIWSS